MSATTERFEVHTGPNPNTSRAPKKPSMDPNQTYLEMFRAMRDGDHVTARDLALALKSWFDPGGFYPYQFTPEAINAYIASVLRRTAHLDF